MNYYIFNDNGKLLENIPIIKNFYVKKSLYRCNSVIDVCLKLYAFTQLSTNKR